MIIIIIIIKTNRRSRRQTEHQKAMSRIPICGLDSWPIVDPLSTLTKGDLIIDPAPAIRASIFTVRSTEYYREANILLMLLVQSFRMVAYFHKFMPKTLVAVWKGTAYVEFQQESLGTEVNSNWNKISINPQAFFTRNLDLFGSHN